MEKIEITKEQLIKLTETAMQLGKDSPELFPTQKDRLKLANWMVDNTIKDIQTHQG